MCALTRRLTRARTHGRTQALTHARTLARHTQAGDPNQVRAYSTARAGKGATTLSDLGSMGSPFGAVRELAAGAVHAAALAFRNGLVDGDGLDAAAAAARAAREAPPPSAARALLERVAADAGVVGIMRERGWRVGALTEMPPVGKVCAGACARACARTCVWTRARARARSRTRAALARARARALTPRPASALKVGVSSACLLGVNKNKGQEISLRLRTDDLRGFRTYDAIMRTMLHELTHMEISDHNNEFKELCSQLGRDYARLDWRGGASARAVGGGRAAAAAPGWQDDILGGGAGAG